MSADCHPAIQAKTAKIATIGMPHTRAYTMTVPGQRTTRDSGYLAMR